MSPADRVDFEMFGYSPDVYLDLARQWELTSAVTSTSAIVIVFY